MKHRTRSALALASGTALAALLLAGCSAPSPGGDDASVLDDTPTVLPAVDCVEPDPAATLAPVTLMLQWLPQTQFAGYYAADCLGYFAEAGLDVDIVPTGGDIVPQEALFDGQADYAIAWVPKVLGSIEAKGIEVTNIAQIFQTSGTLQVSFAGSGIESVADFEGQRIGSWGFGNEWEIFAAMAAEGLDSTSVSITTQDFSMNALLDGDVDAAQAMTYNEWAQVLETVNPDTGELYQPGDFDVVSYSDTVGAMLQDAIWTRTADLEDEAFAEQTVQFLTAVIKGWVYARDFPEEAASITWDVATNAEAAFPVGPGHQLWQMNEVNKLVWPAPAGIGVVDAEAWAQTVDGSLASVNQDGVKLITQAPPASAYSNEFILEAISRVEAEGVDLTGDTLQPITVVLKVGGV